LLAKLPGLWLLAGLQGHTGSPGPQGEWNSLQQPNEVRLRGLHLACRRAPVARHWLPCGHRRPRGPMRALPRQPPL